MKNHSIKRIQNPNKQLKRLKDLLDRGLLCMDSHQYEAATEIYAKAIEEFPKHSMGYSCLGTAMIKIEKYDEAEVLMSYALDLNPNDEVAGINIGVIYKHKGMHAKALQHGLDLITRHPNSSKAYNTLGCALADLQQYQAAIDSFETALQIDNHNIEAWVNIAKIHSDIRQSDLAIYFYQKALEILEKTNDPRIPFVKFYLSFELLSKGEFKQGWELYDYGFSDTIPQIAKRSPNRQFNFPKWHGQTVHDKKLLIWREQGLGG